jgi:hypothetical protein
MLETKLAETRRRQRLTVATLTPWALGCAVAVAWTGAALLLSQAVEPPAALPGRRAEGLWLGATLTALGGLGQEEWVARVARLPDADRGLRPDDPDVW